MSMGEKKTVGDFYFDFYKSSDLVQHDILILKPSSPINL